MDATAFGALVHRLERSAAAAPAAYRARVAALAMLGYAYILGILALLVLFTAIVGLAMVEGAALLGWKLLIPLLVAIAAVLKALWVEFSPPVGLELTRERAPRLFEMARDVARRLHAPPVHAIVAVPDLNAAVMQVPRLGIFGWYRNYLLVGLALMQAVSPEEWRAILAHEMGHLSGSHGRFGAWIYRLRATWGRLLETLEQSESRFGNALFQRFANWYAPYFNAYTFVLARAQEYDADAASAELVGAETARRALTRIAVAVRQTEAFWGQLYAGTARLPEPPPDAGRQLGAALRVAPPAADAASWVTAAWLRPTDYADTHPALADRLRALGWRSASPDAAPPPPEPFDGPSAAEAYLGAAEGEIAEYYDRLWTSEVGKAWRDRHAEIEKMRGRLAELDAQGDAGDTVLAPELEWERMRLCEELGDTERASALAERFLEREPRHSGLRFRVAVWRLERGDASAVEAFEQLMRDDPRTVLEACRVLFGYYQSRGEEQTAERYRERAEQWQHELDLAEVERSAITAAARFEPHGLDSAVVDAMRERLEKYELREVYLARRVVQHAPAIPCYVVGVVPPRRLFRLGVSKEEVALRDSIARDLSDGPVLYVFLAVHDLAELRWKLQAVPGARVR